MTGSVDKERAVDIAYLQFREAFDMVSHNILKLMTYELHGRTQGRWKIQWPIKLKRC